MVSIIMPVYNSEQFISQAIESVINQTYKDYELIIVDDGSNDKSKLIIDNYMNLYHNIKYIYQSNQGPSKARNTGFEHSSGEFIAFLDSDDMFEVHRLENAINFLMFNLSIDIAYNPVTLIDADNNIINTLKAEVVFSCREDMLAYTLFRQTIPCPPSLLLRRKCLEKVKYPENIVYAEDYCFTIELLKYFNFGYLDSSLYRYRRHESNLTNKHSFQKSSEINIIKNIGKEKLIKIVNNANYSSNDKYFLVAKIMYKIEEYKDSIFFLNLVNDNDFLKHFYLGNCYYKLDDFDSSIASYNNAIKINKNLSEAYNNLGCTYFKIGLYELASNCFIDALKCRQGYLDARNNLKIKNCSELNFTDRELRKVLINYS